MKILSIEPNKNKRNKKNKIILDNDTFFYLYDSEIKKLNLNEESEIDSVLYDTIFEEYLFARAKKKALAILDKTMSSKEQIRTKLRRNDFGDDVIDKVIELLEEYNLLNDYEYAKAYIESYKNKKSIRELKIELQKRGIDKDIIEELVSEIDDTELELANIEKIVRKYRDAEGNIPVEKHNKIKASLYRKGYKLDNILKVIKENTDDYY